MLAVGRWLLVVGLGAKSPATIFPAVGRVSDFFVIWCRFLNYSYFSQSSMSESAFSDLRVWRSAMDLAIEVYRQTASFPQHKMYSLTQQMRRAAVSIPSNIAEGNGRRSAKEFRQFLFQAPGSLLELQTQAMIAKRLDYFSEPQAKEILEQAGRVGRSLSA